MALFSNYPGGFAAGVTIRGVPLVQTHPGKAFWVDNSSLGSGDSFKSGSDANKGTYDAPFSTLTGALAQARANKGDIIFIKPGHAESITAAGGIVLSKAGVAIIGLGAGSNRPTFTFTTANTATITVTAVNVLVSNILFIGGFLNVATCFAIANAQVATDFTVDSCEFRDSSTILNFVKIVNVGTTANIADGLTFTNNKIYGKATTPAAGTTAVVVASDTARVTINGNFIVHDIKLDDTPILFEGGALNHTGLSIGGNNCYRASVSCASTGHLIGSSSTASTGHVYDNYVKTLDVAAMLISPTATKLGFTQNFLSGTADTSGINIPAADSDAS
jgi:hypothetical protein